MNNNGAGTESSDSTLAEGRAALDESRGGDNLVARNMADRVVHLLDAVSFQKKKLYPIG